MTGANGYEYLRLKVGYPLPSYRTLCRRIEQKTFEPGLHNEIISFVGSRIRLEPEPSRLCVLIIDEMQLRPKLEFDKGLKRYVGTVSPEIARHETEQQSLATHALAFLVRGLTVNWKQTVAYLLTPSSTDPQKLWECIKTLIELLTEQGLDVKAVVSDMGPNNVGMWNLNGIHAIRGAQVSPSCPHPVNPSQPLYWVADAAHLLKNIRASLQSQDIILPEDVVRENNLPTDRVSLKHVEKLVNVQNKAKDRGFVLAPGLTSRHICPGQFEKMKVHFSATVLSGTTAKALRFCAQQQNIPEIGEEAMATAWFIDQVNDWFDLMNCRVDGIETGRIGEAKIAKLQAFVTLMKALAFTKPGWKPIQCGVLLSTTSAIRLHEELVSNGPLQFLLTGRLTSNAIENLFSQVRACADAHPGPVMLRHGMRLISVSQFLHIPRGANCNTDDAQYLVDFLKTRSTSKYVYLKRYCHNNKNNIYIFYISCVYSKRRGC